MHIFSYARQPYKSLRLIYVCVRLLWGNALAILDACSFTEGNILKHIRRPDSFFLGGNTCNTLHILRFYKGSYALSPNGLVLCPKI